VWAAYDDGNCAIIPKKVDVSDPNTAYFYFSSARAGTAIIGSGTITSTASGGGGSSFYHLVVRESESGGAVHKTTKVTFDSDYFYTQTGGDGGPIVSGAGLTRKVVFTEASAVEWQCAHNLGTSFVVWNAYDTGNQAIIPGKVDVSNPNTAFFYFAAARAGFAVIIG
jgi:hypothetical protein